MQNFRLSDEFWNGSICDFDLQLRGGWMKDPQDEKETGSIWKVTRRDFIDGAALALGAGFIPTTAASSQGAPAKGQNASQDPIHIGSRRELFVDRLLVDKLDGVRFKLGEPIPREPALSVDRPWEGIWLW